MTFFVCRKHTAGTSKTQLTQDTAYTSEDLVRVLASWQQECCLNINGAGCNKVKLVLETLPDNLIVFD